MAHSVIGFVDIYSRKDHYERPSDNPRILQLEVEEAVDSFRAHHYGWDYSKQNGLRVLANGFTFRRRSVFLVLIPADSSYERFPTHMDPVQYGEEEWADCTDWTLITAYPVKPSP